MPESIDYLDIAKAQPDDTELRLLPDSDNSLKMIPLDLSPSNLEVLCDISTGTVRPDVPKYFRLPINLMLHNISHPRVKVSVDLIRKRFVRKSLRRDVAEYAQKCIACQKSKIHRHVKS